MVGFGWFKVIYNPVFVIILISTYMRNGIVKKVITFSVLRATIVLSIYTELNESMVI